MQNLLKNQKIQGLLGRRKSKELVEQIHISVEEKKEKIEKIRTQLKDRNKGTKKIANDMLENANKEGEKVGSIIDKDINTQEENFKKRLEERRLQRGNSQPHLKLKVKFFLKNKNLNYEIKTQNFILE